jgi:hypothetical protein
VKSVDALNPAALTALLGVQGIELKPGRAERIAAGVQELLAAVAADPLRADVEFEAEACAFAGTLARWRACG